MKLNLTMSLTVYLLLLVVVFEPAATKVQKLNKDGLNEEDLPSANPTTKHSQNAAYGCKFGDSTCSQDIIDHVLGNLTNNSVINITHNVVLSSNITLANLINISIIGYNNPVITCHNGTGIYILSSHNCIIEGIIWNGCGTQYLISYTVLAIEFRINPGICFQYSSNITVKNCFFKYSKGQALTLLNVSGDVNIYQCKFVNCSNDGGHGAALYYSSSLNLQ